MHFKYIVIVYRYFSVFHQTFLSCIEDRKIIRTTRIFAVTMSLGSTFFEDLSHGQVFALLTKGEVNEGMYQIINLEMHFAF